ncbi:helix-turn-helix domain-containing protein [Streptomyces sp. NPDC060002]|uniref:helix-turn-helix domain-containing protein n=1 Tax=Streptomyces sp. NPDC060002 TaxID=3347033 RepID=UPI00369EF12A
MEHLARRAIMTIRENYHEPLALDDLARSVMMSKFYFLRVFQRTTGVTPGRFLSAVRIQEAKCLLVHTHANVADISARVGYSSPSTFSRRFTDSVGLSPTQYRKISRGECEEFPRITPLPVATGPLGSISGTAHLTGTPLSPLYVGVFDSPILQGQPVAWTRPDGAGAFSLENVPPGTWYLHAVTLGTRASGDQCCGSPLLVGATGPVEIGAGTPTCLDIAVRQEDWSRPPVLLALPGLGRKPSRLPPAEGAARPPGPAAPEAGYRAPRRPTATVSRLVGV